MMMTVLFEDAVKDITAEDRIAYEEGRLAGLLYANYLVWQSYLEVVFWAFLLSQALRPLKFAVVSNHCIQRACICVSICLRV